MYAAQLREKQGRVIPMHPTDAGANSTTTGHAWIAARIVEDSDLSPYAFRIYALIRLHDFGKGQGCFLARAELARLGHMSEAAVVRALRDLRRRGYITTQPSTDGLTANRHFCTNLPPLALVNGCPTDTPIEVGGVPQTPRGCQRATPTGVPQTPKVDRTEVDELKYDSSPSGEGADAPPAAQNHGPAHSAPTQDARPPAIVAVTPESEQRQAESSGFVFAEDVPPPVSASPPRRQSSTSAAAEKPEKDAGAPYRVFERWCEATGTAKGLVSTRQKERILAEAKRELDDLTARYEAEGLSDNPEADLCGCLGWVAGKPQFVGGKTPLAVRYAREDLPAWRHLGKPAVYTLPVSVSGNGYARARAAPVKPEVQAERDKILDARRQKFRERYGDLEGFE